MVRMATERFAGLGDSAFISARQENLETIHKHNVVAERHGLMGELLARDRDGRASAEPRRRCASGSSRPRPTRSNVHAAARSRGARSSAADGAADGIRNTDVRRPSLTQKHIPLSQDAALVVALAGTAMPFAHSAEDEAERWLRALRLHGQVGAALQALGVGESPLMTGLGREPGRARARRRSGPTCSTR